MPFFLGNFPFSSRIDCRNQCCIRQDATCQHALILGASVFYIEHQFPLLSFCRRGGINRVAWRFVGWLLPRFVGRMGRTHGLLALLAGALLAAAAHVTGKGRLARTVLVAGAHVRGMLHGACSCLFLFFSITSSFFHFSAMK